MFSGTSIIIVIITTGTYPTGGNVRVPEDALTQRTEQRLILGILS